MDESCHCRFCCFASLFHINAGQFETPSGRDRVYISLHCGDDRILSVLTHAAHPCSSCLSSLFELAMMSVKRAQRPLRDFVGWKNFLSASLPDLARSCPSLKYFYFIFYFYFLNVGGKSGQNRPILPDLALSCRQHLKIKNKK